MSNIQAERKKNVKTGRGSHRGPETARPAGSGAAPLCRGEGVGRGMSGRRPLPSGIGWSAQTIVHESGHATLLWLVKCQDSATGWGTKELQVGGPKSYRLGGKELHVWGQRARALCPHICRCCDDDPIALGRKLSSSLPILPAGKCAERQTGTRGAPPAIPTTPSHPGTPCAPRKVPLQGRPGSLRLPPVTAAGTQTGACPMH